MVHIHAEGPAFFCWIPKLFGKRVISTIHGLDWAREKWKFGVGSKFIRQGEKNAVKYADEIIVLSKGVQKYFMETYGRETHFIPNGVNRPEVREAKLITDHFGLEKDSYILFLGRLVPEKGIRYLVEAFKNVKTDKKLVIAGGSSDTDSFMEELKELAKGDDRILFTGFVQGAMLDELYSNAYIYTLPSDLEGMPLSLLEAMSYGNCCLVSDIPECAEVVEDNITVARAMAKLGTDRVLTVYGHLYNPKNLPQGKNIEFKGLVPQTQLYEEMRKSELYILNSVYEPFALSVYDALICGCSVLVTNVAGALELLNVTEHDVIFDPMDENEIANKIDYLLENPNNTRLLSSLDFNKISYKGRYR